MEGYENSVTLYVEIHFYCESFVEYLLTFLLTLTKGSDQNSLNVHPFVSHFTFLTFDFLKTARKNLTKLGT